MPEFWGLQTERLPPNLISELWTQVLMFELTFDLWGFLSLEERYLCVAFVVADEFCLLKG